ncbi:response regulator transcription factor [Halarsenatibacter silvermanii]|uniref:Stage 0 sporulation protein A homolog n=1 Tax=Halarsenatibacter silvermanii TaxID=321763 RepID=A0A1G9P7B8_9FIRM|nr:response regulator transcription factor [Halarsenatibacter silvermanii]SDL94676.1 DNA-binding response regulator, OmpR family, contains REC and winged-helix (wHTH) domain [Halarsenatibacter silvermanii]
MQQYEILIIDDDDHILEILTEYFEYENFSVETASTGREALEKIDDLNPDLIVLDIMLPEMDGWEVCQQLRPSNQIPIIILSAKTKDSDRIMGLELGADDYVTKPFSPREIVARAKAVLRRISRENDREKEMIDFDTLKINKNQRIVIVEDEEVDLTPKEFDLLWTLASFPLRVFEREKLLEKVWGYDYFGDIRTVDTHIKSLRKKLGKAGECIKTVWGVGYKFDCEEDG